ncbi:MAG: glycosyltransferase [Cyanobacteria bacterium J06639_16]
MKIAFLVEKFPTLSETFVLNQITELIQRGHEIDIYAMYAEQSDKVHPEVELYHLLQHTFYQPSLPKHYILRLLKGIGIFLSCFWKNIFTTLKTLNIFKYGRYAASLRLFYEAVPFLKNNSPKYDIVYCHFGYIGLKGFILRQLGVIDGALITVFHGYDLSGYFLHTSEQVYRDIFQLGDLFLPISDHWKKRLIELGCPTQKIMVHRMGIEDQKFRFNPRQLQSNDSIHIITIARLVEKKGIEYGIRAIAQLRKHQNNLRYTIVGDGLLKQEFESLISDLNLGSMVTLAGWRQQNEVVELLQKSHILLAPSVTAKDGDKEGIPVALMEAMATGLIVISTFHSGIPELIEDGQSGYLVPERNTELLADKINWVIEHQENWLTIQKSARQVIEQKYNNRVLNDSLEAIFLQVLEGEDLEEARQSIKVGV